MATRECCQCRQQKSNPGFFYVHSGTQQFVCTDCIQLFIDDDMPVFTPGHAGATRCDEDAAIFTPLWDPEEAD